VVTIPHQRTLKQLQRSLAVYRLAPFRPGAQKPQHLRRSTLPHTPTTVERRLQAFAAQLDPSIGGLDRRRFHAVYVGAARTTGKPRRQGRKLRRIAATAPKPSVARGPEALPVSILSTAQPVSPDRARIRAALLEFVGELSRSDDRVHWVRVISRVDDFVSMALASLWVGRS
jgi:hypothetical protein